MTQHQVLVGDMVRRWASAHVIAYCVLVGLATGRLIASWFLPPAYGIMILLLALHLVAANAILARILLVRYSKTSQWVAGLAGVSVSLAITAGISGVMSQLSPGSMVGGLLITLPGSALTGVALTSAWKDRGSVLSVTSVAAAVLMVPTWVGMFTKADGMVRLVLSALESAAMNAVWLSAIYVAAGFILQSKLHHRGRQSAVIDI